MNSPQLAELERRAYRTLVDDGLLDIGLGLFFFAFLLGEHLPFDGFAGIAFLLIALGWKAARRQVIETRVGTVRLNADRKSRLQTGKRWVTGLMVVPGTALIVGVLVFSDADPPLLGYGSLVVAGIFGGALFVGGWLFEVRRFWIYALVLIAAAAWETYVSEPFDGFQFAPSGCLAVVSGTFVLARFLRRYPRPPTSTSKPETSRG